MAENQQVKKQPLRKVDPKKQDLIRNVMSEKDPRVQADKIRILQKEGILTGKDIPMLFGSPTKPVKTETPISTINSIFTPPPRPTPTTTSQPSITDIGVEPLTSLEYGKNDEFEKEQEIEAKCRRLRRLGRNPRFCREYYCKKNPFGRRCRGDQVLTSGTGAGQFDKETGVSTLETSKENLQYCLENPNDPTCKKLYNEELINSLEGGIDNIYASSLELPSDCLTNPSKVDLNSCESLHPKDIYQNMDKSEVNEPMQPQAPLEQQVGVSNLTENPITDTISQPKPTLSMYLSDSDCKKMLNPSQRINNLPKIKPKRNFGGNLNPITKKSSGNFFRARNPMGNGLNIYNKSFENPLEYL